MSDIHRHNADDLRPDRYEDLVTWLRSLGLTVEDYDRRFAIVAGERGWELHLSRYQRNDDGHIVIDVARDQAVTTPHIVQLGTSPKWPWWLNPLL